jgi:hypothetical protein
MIWGRILAAAAAQEDSVTEQAALAADRWARESGLAESWVCDDADALKQRNKNVRTIERLRRITLYLAGSSPARWELALERAQYSGKGW